MPLLDITNPKIINFLLENYETETKIRMRWVSRHKDRIQECATFKSEVKDFTEVDINRVSIIAGMAALSKDHIVREGHRKKSSIDKNVCASFKIEKEQTSEPIKTMRPVKENVSNLLFESKNNYLEERNKMSPEDKYYFTESTNWNYGWELNDSELKMRGPLYGKVAHLQNELHNNTGPQPDPVHYGFPSTNNKLCFEL